MRRDEQVFQFVGGGLPFLGLPAAILVLWGHGASAADLAIMASLYTLTGLGVAVGYHIAGLGIGAMGRVGLAWNVVEISEQRQIERTATNRSAA